ncbi:MAG TPA: (2Fe-2S)-binding protein [Actinomycetota bacterium]
MAEVRCVVNGELLKAEVKDDRLLCDFLREDLGLLGTRVGCREGVCGSCNVLLGGFPVRSCLFLAPQADGEQITTVEGLSEGDHLHPLQRAFIDAGAVQCGFCTAGILITAKALLDRNPEPSEHEVLEALAGNLCRCSAYGKIVDAIRKAAVSSK